MSIDEIAPKNIKIKVLGEEKTVKFTLRNFAAIEKRFGIPPDELLPRLSSGDLTSIIAALWGSTVEFAPFRADQPVDIKNELSIEKLYELDLKELSEISQSLIGALVDNLPEEVQETEEENPGSEDAPGKKTGAGPDGST